MLMRGAAVATGGYCDSHQYIQSVIPKRNHNPNLNPIAARRYIIIIIVIILSIYISRIDDRPYIRLGLQTFEGLPEKHTAHCIAA